MRKLAEIFSGSPYVYALISTILICVAYYGYSRTLPQSTKETNKATAKVTAITFLVHIALAYITVMGQAEPISSVPFTDINPPAPTF